MKALRIFATIVLLSAIVFQILAYAIDEASPALIDRGPLSNRLPMSLGSVAARDEPIAETDEMRRAVMELLNYDDAIFRVYQARSWRLSVYAAWWSRGKMSPRLIHAHIPDVCWPANGWIQGSFSEAEAFRNELVIAEHNIRNGALRKFSKDNRNEYVIYWHLVDDEDALAGGALLLKKTTWINEIFSDGIRLRRSQLFIRVSSDTPIDEVFGKDEVRPLLDALGGLGLMRR